MYSGCGCTIDPEVCDCSCHQDGGTHVTACCSECQYCGKRIKVSRVESHEKTCSQGPHFLSTMEIQQNSLRRAQERSEKNSERLGKA